MNAATAHIWLDDLGNDVQTAAVGMCPEATHIKYKLFIPGVVVRRWTD